MAYRFFNPVEQFHDGAGTLLSGGKLFFYEPSTLTLRNTYSDEALTTANTNPIVLNSAGRPAVDTWLSGSYRIILKDANDITIWDRDPYREPATATNVQNSDSTWGGTAGGSANALTITLSPAITAYTAGQEFEFIVASNNTGAATLNVNGKGAIAITKDGATALVANDLKANQVAKVKYDGTRFQLISPNSMLLANGGNARIRADVASAATVDLDAINGFYARITGTTTITAITLADGKWRDVVAGDAFSITTGASLIINGIATGKTITFIAGDIFKVFGEASSVVRINIERGIPGWIFLESKTASSSAQIDFVLPSSYTEFVVKLENILPATDNVSLWTRLSTDGGSSFLDTSYWFAGLGINSAGTALNFSSGGIASNRINLISDNDAIKLSNVAGEDLEGLVYFHSMNISARAKLTADAVYERSDNTMFNFRVGGGRAITGVYNAVRFLMDSGNIASGSFALYAIR